MHLRMENRLSIENESVKMPNTGVRKERINKEKWGKDSSKRNIAWGGKRGGEV